MLFCVKNNELEQNFGVLGKISSTAKSAAIVTQL